MENSVANLQNAGIPMMPADVRQPNNTVGKVKDEFQSLLKDKEFETDKESGASKDSLLETEKETVTKETITIPVDTMQLIHLFDPAKLKVMMGSLNQIDNNETTTGSGIEEKVDGLPKIPGTEAEMKMEIKTEVKTEPSIVLSDLETSVSNQSSQNMLVDALVPTKDQANVVVPTVDQANAAVPAAKSQEAVVNQAKLLPEAQIKVNEPVQKLETPAEAINGDNSIAQPPVDLALSDSVSSDAGHSQAAPQQSEKTGIHEKLQDAAPQPTEYSTAALEASISQTTSMTDKGTGLRTPQMETPETVYVNVNKPEEIPQKIADTMITKLDSGQKEIEIQLEPHNLGKIAIKVTYGQNNTAISISCSNPKTLEILAQNAKELGVIIETNLGSPTTIYVDKSVEDYLDQNLKDNSGQDRGQQENKESEQNNKNQNDDRLDFIQQLRLGLVTVAS